MDDATATIRRVLAEESRLAQPIDALPLDADLYQAGMDSHASVNVMLALESAFNVTFPDRLMTRSVFCSIGAIRAALGELHAA